MSQDQGEVIDLVKGQDEKWGLPPSAKERWENATRRDVERDTRLREEEVKKFANLGIEIGKLLYTSDGQRKINNFRTILGAVVDDVAEGSKPKLSESYDSENYNAKSQQAIVEIRRQIIERWESGKKERVDDLLRGRDMTNLEEKSFLDRRPDASDLSDSPELTRKILEEFAKDRKMIGAAFELKEELGKKLESKPVIPHDFSPSEAELRFHGVSIEQANDSFRQGLNSLPKQESSK